MLIQFWVELVWLLGYILLVFEYIRAAGYILLSKFGVEMVQLIGYTLLLISGVRVTWNDRVHVVV